MIISGLTAQSVEGEAAKAPKEEPIGDDFGRPTFACKGCQWVS